MIINNKFTYKTLERITRQDGVRHYRCPETGLLVPSVTTVLSFDSSSKQGLLEWRKFVGDKKADEICKEATTLGTMVHERIEASITGIPAPRGNYQLRKLAETMAQKIIDNGLKSVDEVWGQEIALYHPGLYAGTTDIVGVYNGKPAIMDHKTAKKMRTKEQIQSYFRQLGAYSLSHNYLYDTDIKTGVIFMVTRDGEFKEFVLHENEMERYQTEFLLTLEKYLTVNTIEEANVMTTSL